MEEIVVQPLANIDYQGVKAVDVATQKQYLGSKWGDLTSAEKESHLVSRKSEFSLHVKSGYCFIAKLDNVIVGFIFAYDTLPGTGRVYIQYIAIDPDFQAKGIGALLLSALINKAKKTKCKEVWSLINLDNPQSMKLHQKVGFILTDRKEASIDLTEKKLDSYL